MKIAHWTMMNNSGMRAMAEAMCKAESMSGLDSWLVNFADPNDWDEILDADIQVVHTHLPDDVRLKLTKPLKVVWMAHGTPEYVFQRSVESGLNHGYGASDSWQLAQYWMKTSDAIVSFWPRQAAIWKQLCDKHTIVDCIPMGIDKGFWRPVESAGKYVGKPSLLTAENPDYSKWPLDLLIAWPWVWPEIPTAALHALYLPTDQMRWWSTLLNGNGSGFKTYSSSIFLSPEGLRNAFVSTDYYIGLARYGTSNLMSRQANACGSTTISFAGNEFSDYWIQEGDQREIAKRLLSILKGDAKPRKKTEVPDISETVEAMKKIYERIL